MTHTEQRDHLERTAEAVRERFPHVMTVVASDLPQPERTRYAGPARMPPDHFESQVEGNLWERDDDQQLLRWTDGKWVATGIRVQPNE